MLTIVVGSVFEEDCKYYPQIFFRRIFVTRVFRRVIKLSQYDVSEGIHNNTTSASKEYMLSYYWCYKDIGYKFEPYACNGCHDILFIAFELKNCRNIKCKKCWL